MTFAEGCWVLYLVVYDVVDDRVRDEMREVLRDFGGVRVQYSAFLVELSRGEVQEAARRLASWRLGRRLMYASSLYARGIRRGLRTYLAGVGWGRVTASFRVLVAPSPGWWVLPSRRRCRCLL